MTVIYTLRGTGCKDELADWNSLGTLQCSDEADLDGRQLKLGVIGTLKSHDIFMFVCLQKDISNVVTQCPFVLSVLM